MSRRRQINAKPRGRKLRSKLAAASTPLRDAAGTVEERLLWRVSDLLRAISEVVRWPFERLAWIVEQRVVWPLQERTAGRGPSGRVAGAGALAAVGLAAVALGVLSLAGGDGNGRTSAPVAVQPVAAPAPAPQPERPEGPALEGVPPSFGSGGVAATDGEESDPVESDPSAVEADPEPVVPDTETEGAATTSSTEKPVPAGPVAMKVARRFAEAFVFYEIGERPERAELVFEETATPQLVEALTERPPRQPESTAVPKARILNLVPGPRRGGAYTVSASLLRVGVTSELRLQMRRLTGAWVVTDVRG